MLTEESFILSWIKIYSKTYQLIEEVSSSKFTQKIQNEEFFSSFLIKHYNLDENELNEDIMHIIPLRRKIMSEIIENKLKEINITETKESILSSFDKLPNKDSIMFLWRLVFMISFYSDLINSNEGDNYNFSTPSNMRLINNVDLFKVAIKIVYDTTSKLREESYINVDHDMREIIFGSDFDPDRSIRMQLTERVINCPSEHNSPQLTYRSTFSNNLHGFHSPVRLKLDLNNIIEDLTDCTTYDTNKIKSCFKCDDVQRSEENVRESLNTKDAIIQRLEQKLEENEKLIEKLKYDIKLLNKDSDEMNTLRYSIREQRRSTRFLNNELDSKQMIICRLNARIEELEQTIAKLEDKNDIYEGLIENMSSVTKENEKLKKLLSKKTFSNIKMVKNIKLSIEGEKKNHELLNDCHLMFFEKINENMALKAKLKEIELNYSEGVGKYKILKEKYLKIRENSREIVTKKQEFQLKFNEINKKLNHVEDEKKRYLYSVLILVGVLLILSLYCIFKH